MYGLVDKAKTDADFQKLIYGIVNRTMPGVWRNYEGEIRTVFNWAKSFVDYRRDPYDVELIQDVWATLDRRRADCDDFCILLGAASEVLGAPSRFVTVSTRPDKEPSHVYLEVFVGGRWLPLDASIQWTQPGWSPPNVTDKKIWTRKAAGLSGDDETMIEGLGMHENGVLHDSDGRPSVWEHGFSQRMFQVQPPPGVSSRGGRTWAHGEKGPATIIPRLDVTKQVDSSGKPRRALGPSGGFAYDELRIISQPTPAQVRTVIRSDLIPAPFDPTARSGAPPVYGNYINPMYLYPDRAVSQEDYLMDLAGLGQFGIGTTASGAAAQTIADKVVESVVASKEPTTWDVISKLIDTGVTVYSASQKAAVAEEQRRAAEVLARARMVPGQPAAAGMDLGGMLPILGIGLAAITLGPKLLGSSTPARRRYRRNAGRRRARRAGRGGGKQLLTLGIIGGGAYLAIKAASDAAKAREQHEY